MVLIKDFDMPSKCQWDCPLCREDGGACDLSDIRTSNVERPKDCPLVEIREQTGSTTNNNLGVDCISRKSIKQKLQEHHDFFVDAYGGFSNLPQNDKSRVDEITNCIAMVVNEPPVAPQEPKTGHWISRWYAGHDLHFHVCSECNEEFSCDMETGISIDNYRYCPNCGAKMESEE